MTCRRIGIVGGLGDLAGADLLFKFNRLASLEADGPAADVILEQPRFADARRGASGKDALGRRKLHVFEVVRALQKRDCDMILLPCFLSHLYLDELREATGAPILDMMQVLAEHLAEKHASCHRIGVMTSPMIREAALFDRALGRNGLKPVYNSADVAEQQLMPAIYGPEGIKAGRLVGAVLSDLRVARDELVGDGCDALLSGFTELPLVGDALAADCPVPFLDCNAIYAEAALHSTVSVAAPKHRIGVVGGVGPLATVDFMEKVIARTPADRDQDHVEMVVEHNPSIPDRTAYLTGEGQDPTLALLATCRKLEARGADLIAIPCNTAHAFIPRLQRHVGIPIIDMIAETATVAKKLLGGSGTVGLLATSGTVSQGLYATALALQDIACITPDDAHQERVMRAIFGPEGVKAGHVTGSCFTDLAEAADSLAARGAGLLILGCTELPLIHAANREAWDNRIAIPALDPTAVLAESCVGLVASRPALLKQMA